MKVILFFILSSLFNCVLAQDLKVYSLLENGDEKSLDQKINQLEEDNSLNKAYKGALLSKKAELLFSPIEKLAEFKKGAKLLEEAIVEDPENIEQRLLRYIIQSNAPSFLGYNKNLSEDRLMLESNALKPSLRQIVLDFNEANKSSVISID